MGGENAAGGDPSPTVSEYEIRAAPLAGVVLGARCPRCGRGALFDGFLAPVPTCAVCGLHVGRQDSADGPAVFVMTVVGFVAVPSLLLVHALYAPSVPVLLLVGALLLVVPSVALLRPAKALMIALQYRQRPQDFIDPASKPPT